MCQVEFSNYTLAPPSGYIKENSISVLFFKKQALHNKNIYLQLKIWLQDLQELQKQNTDVMNCKENFAEDNFITSSSGMMVTQTSWTKFCHLASRRTAASTTHTCLSAKNHINFRNYNKTGRRNMLPHFKCSLHSAISAIYRVSKISFYSLTSSLV